MEGEDVVLIISKSILIVLIILLQIISLHMKLFAAEGLYSKCLG